MTVTVLAANQQCTRANVSDLCERRWVIDEGHAEPAILGPVRRRTMDHPRVMNRGFPRLERCGDRLESRYIEIGDLAARQHVAILEIISDGQLAQFVRAREEAHGAALRS